MLYNIIISKERKEIKSIITEYIEPVIKEKPIIPEPIIKKKPMTPELIIKKKTKKQLTVKIKKKQNLI